MDFALATTITRGPAWWFQYLRYKLSQWKGGGKKSTQPLVSLNAVNATGAGTAFNVGIPSNNWGIQITDTGSPASISITLQGSLDNGTTWNNIGSAITSTGLSFITNSPCSMIRLNLGTLSGGSSPTVTGIVIGY